MLAKSFQRSQAYGDEVIRAFINHYLDKRIHKAMKARDEELELEDLEFRRRIGKLKEKHPELHFPPSQLPPEYFDQELEKPVAEHNERPDKQEGPEAYSKLSPLDQALEELHQARREELISLIRSVVTIELAKFECPECKPRTKA